MKPQLVTLQKHGETSKGFLSAIESCRQFPGAIERLFYIYGVSEGMGRGGHAHREVTQMFLVLSGMAAFKVRYKAQPETSLRRDCFILNAPEQALILYPQTWLTIDILRDNTVVACLCDGYYDEAEYIRSWEEWLNAQGVVPAGTELLRP